MCHRGQNEVVVNVDICVHEKAGQRNSSMLHLSLLLLCISHSLISQLEASQLLMGGALDPELGASAYHLSGRAVIRSQYPMCQQGRACWEDSIKVSYIWRSAALHLATTCFCTGGASETLYPSVPLPH
jgi:hypothetical protein